MVQKNQSLRKDFVTVRSSTANPKVALPRMVVIWWSVTLVAVPLIIYMANRKSSLEVITYLGLWLLISVVCLYFVKKWSFSVRLGKGIDFLEIPVYLSFTGLMLIGLFGAVPYLDRKYLLPSIDLSTDLPFGLLLMGIGYLAMWGGYTIAVVVLNKHAAYRNVRSGRDFDFNNPVLFRAIGLYSLIIILKLFLFSNSSNGQVNLGPLQQPLIFLLESSWLLLALFTVQTTLGRWPRWIFVAVIVMEISTAVLSGWSSGLLKILFVLFASVSYTGKRMSYPLLLIVVFAGFVLTPVARSMRNADRSSLSNVTNSLVASTNAYWGESSQGTSFNQELLVGRQSGTAQLPALILKLTPSRIPYRSTTELMSIPISFIPRALWPDKLESGGKGIAFAEEYLGLVGHGAAATTMAGSAYMYGGWVIVILMMGTAGIIFALTYYLIMIPALNKQQVGLFALYAGIVIANFHIGEGDIAGLWQGLVQRTAVLFCCLFVLCIRKR